MDDVFACVCFQSFCCCRSYGGFDNEQIGTHQIEALINDLVDDGIAMEGIYDVYKAGYDSPHKLDNRHNEIWICNRYY